MQTNVKLIISIILALISAVIIWEVILENTIIKTTGFTKHAVLGRIYKPGTYLHGTEGFGKTIINSLGMRSTEIEPKEKNEFRILALGDSFTEAFHVNDNDTYVLRLKEILSKSFDKKVSAVNAGRSFASPSYYIHLADYYNKLAQPDLVVVQLNELDFTVDVLNKNRDFFIQKDNNNKYGTIYNPDFFTGNKIVKKYPHLYFLFDYSLVRIAADKINKLFLKPKKKNTSKSNVTVNPEEAFIFDNPELIEWILLSLKNKYKNFVVLYLPEVDYQNTSISDSLIESKLKDLSNKNNIDFINMREDFLDYYNKYKKPANGFNNTIPGSGHLNSLGHKLVAEKLASYIKSRGTK